MARTRYFYDGEFLEDGKTINLISIGIVADDGREYYAINLDADWERISRHPWLVENVLPHLPGWWNLRAAEWRPDATNALVKPRGQIAAEVAAFLTANSTDWRDNELWAYYAAYDHVMLCQLWGTMMQLPRGVPMWTNDLQQLAWQMEQAGQTVVKPPQRDEHHALADARWNAELLASLLDQQVYGIGRSQSGAWAISEGADLVTIPSRVFVAGYERLFSVGPDEGIETEEDRDRATRLWEALL